MGWRALVYRLSLLKLENYVTNQAFQVDQERQDTEVADTYGQLYSDAEDAVLQIDDSSPEMPVFLRVKVNNLKLLRLFPML